MRKSSFRGGGSRCRSSGGWRGRGTSREKQDGRKENRGPRAGHGITLALGVYSAQEPLERAEHSKPATPPIGGLPVSRGLNLAETRERRTRIHETVVFQAHPGALHRQLLSHTRSNPLHVDTGSSSRVSAAQLRRLIRGMVRLEKPVHGLMAGGEKPSGTRECPPCHSEVSNDTTNRV